MPAGYGNTICVVDIDVGVTAVPFTATVEPGRNCVPVTVIGWPAAALSGATSVIVGADARRNRRSIALLMPNDAAPGGSATTDCSVTSRSNGIAGGGTAIVNGSGPAAIGAPKMPNASAMISSVGPSGSTGMNMLPKLNPVPGAPGFGCSDATMTHGRPGPLIAGARISIANGWNVVSSSVRGGPPALPSTSSTSSPSVPA